MSNHPQAPHGHGDYEREDLNTNGPIAFLGGLALLCIVTYLLLLGMFRLINRYDQQAQSPVNPMALNVPKDTRHVQPGEIAAFPEPRLEEDERGQLNHVRVAEEETLSSYGYVDEKAGVVRIPVERAMQLVVEHGLPVHAAGDAAPVSVAGTAAAAPRKAGVNPAKKK